MSMTVKKIHRHFIPPHSSLIQIVNVEVLQPRIPHKTSLCCSQSIDQKCHGSTLFHDDHDDHDAAHDDNDGPTSSHIPTWWEYGIMMKGGNMTQSHSHHVKFHGLYIDDNFEGN